MTTFGPKLPCVSLLRCGTRLHLDRCSLALTSAMYARAMSAIVDEWTRKLSPSTRLLSIPSLALWRAGVNVRVGRRGVELLVALLEADGAVVSKDILLQRVWPQLTVGEANLSVQIAALRKALGPSPSGGEWTETVPRVGYRFSGSQSTIAAIENGGPRLAVLPFENLSADGTEQYFIDGVVEDIVTALSRFTTFSVLSRSALCALREQRLDPRSAA